MLKLLEAVVVAAGERMRFVKLEGDAALFVSQGHADDGGRTAAALDAAVAKRGAFVSRTDLVEGCVWFTVRAARDTSDDKS